MNSWVETSGTYQISQNPDFLGVFCRGWWLRYAILCIILNRNQYSCFSHQKAHTSFTWICWICTGNLSKVPQYWINQATRVLHLLADSTGFFVYLQILHHCAWSWLGIAFENVTLHDDCCCWNCVSLIFFSRPVLCRGDWSILQLLW
jgi:hypothetical protein